MEQYRQRFTIDDHLKRYEKALLNLFQGGEHFIGIPLFIVNI